MHRLRTLGFLCLLVTTLACVWLSNAEAIRRIQIVTSIGATDASGTAIQPAGKTHSLVLPLVSMDAHWWLLHTEQLRADANLVRHTSRDNPPAGREVHWSSSITFLLTALGWTIEQTSGTPAADSLQIATLWLGPVCLLFILGGLFWLTLHRRGLACATLLVALLGTSSAFTSAFAPGEADHHGLAITFCLLSVWLLATAAPPPTSRRSFAVSGIAGGAALWISAATAIPVLVAIAVGAVFAAVLTRRDPNAPCAPSLRWSTWANWGALTSLAFYAVEYLPDHASLRLEINHPLYALAWWSAGGLLARLLQRIQGQPSPVLPRHRLLTAAQLTGLLTPAALIVFGGTRFFVLGDPLLWALHRDYIHEFRSFAAVFSTADWLVFPAAWFLLPVGLWTLVHTRRHRPEFLAPLSLVLVASTAAVLLTIFQIRWQGLAAALLAPLGACLCAILWPAVRTSPASPPAEPAPLRITVFASFALTLLQNPLLTFLVAPARGHEPVLERSELASLATRDVAWALHGIGNPADTVVLSGPTTSTQLAYFGGFRVLGTLYWENLAGLRAAAAIFGTDDPETALQLCQKHGITHLVLFSWDDFGAAYARLHALAQTGTATPPPQCLSRLLAAHRIPRWLRPIAYDLPPALGLADQRVQIYEIHPTQTNLEACLHLARYHREVADPASALRTLTRAADLLDAPDTANTPDDIILDLARAADLLDAPDTANTPDDIILDLAREALALGDESLTSRLAAHAR